MSAASAPARHRNPVQRLFAWKIHGIRWIDIIGVVLIALTLFSVYVAKAAAARESAQIGEMEQDIAETRQRVRLLRAEAARLEAPGRLEALSRAAGLAPVDVHRQATEAQISALKPVAVPAPVPAPSIPAEPSTPDVVVEAPQ